VTLLVQIELPFWLQQLLPLLAFLFFIPLLIYLLTHGEDRTSAGHWLRRNYRAEEIAYLEDQVRRWVNSFPSIARQRGSVPQPFPTLNPAAYYSLLAPFTSSREGVGWLVLCASSGYAFWISDGGNLVLQRPADSTRRPPRGLRTPDSIARRFLACVAVVPQAASVEGALQVILERALAHDVLTVDDSAIGR
jgi:hypothetical protein